MAGYQNLEVSWGILLCSGKGSVNFESEKRRPFPTMIVDDLEIKRTPSNFVFLKRPLVDRSVNSQQKRKTSTRWNAFEIYQFYLIILINTFSYFFLYEVVHAKFTLSFKAYFPNLLVWRWTQSSFHQKRIPISVNRQAKIKQKVCFSITHKLCLLTFESQQYIGDSGSLKTPFMEWNLG